MAGTEPRDMRYMSETCIPSYEFGVQMARIFSANRNRAGVPVYNHAGSEPRIGDANKYVLFADVKHRMNIPNYIPSKTAASFLKVEVVNQEEYIEVSAAISEALRRFLRPSFELDRLMDFATLPFEPNRTMLMQDMYDRRGVRWLVRGFSTQDLPPYIIIFVRTEGVLEDLMNAMFDLDPDYEIASSPRVSML